MSEEVTIEICKMQPAKTSTGVAYYLYAHSNKLGSILSPQAWVRKSTAEKWAKKMKEANERHEIPTKIVDKTEKCEAETMSIEKFLTSRRNTLTHV